jgi:phosphatidylserine/phosphatidylglycerophosphate/cardiolipin synthase-like enzyme
MAQHLRLSVPSFAAAALVTGFAVAAGAVIPIADLHHNTSSGTPAAPYVIGTLVEVAGVVTVPDSVNSYYSTQITIQDATGAIQIFKSGGLSGGAHFALGDSVTFQAYVAQFNGLTELGDGAQYAYTIHGTGAQLPEPLLMTCADMNDAWHPDYTEPDESRLIRINDAVIVSGTWPSVPSGANVTLTINDGTENATLFIDKDSEVNGSPDPGGPFDIVGELRQYDPSSPYTSGYEIVPRFVTDVLPVGPGPRFGRLGRVTDIDQTTATIEWETLTPGTSIVQYGTDESYGQEVSDPTPKTQHSMSLAGLDPATLYHFRVGSEDETGTRWDGDRLLHTAQTTPGSMAVFFNRSVDHGYAEIDSADGNVFLNTTVIESIDAAQHSIDVMVYSFSLTNIANALISRFNAGVDVRVIVEQDVSGGTAQQSLIDAGIPLITSTYGGNHGADDDYGIHHNKVYIFDARDQTDILDDYVLTGSWNASTAGNDDANNMVLIQDHGLATAYTLEFEEEWGSSTNTPNASNAKFGVNKRDNTPHLFRIGGEFVESYFSPSDAVINHMAEAVGTSDFSNYFCILSFTNQNLSEAMRAKYESIPDFQVRGVFEGSDVGPIENGSEWYAMSGDPAAFDPWDPPADVHLDGLPGGVDLHHKYLLIDSGHFESDPIVVTGSANWSFSADTRNDENTLVIHSRRIANLYHQEWAARYHEAGGTGDIDVVATPGAGAVTAPVRVFPNPFPASAAIHFTLDEPARVGLRVFDAAGRLVRALREPAALAAGPHAVVWDGRDETGRAVGSGVYFVEMRDGSGASVVKALRIN